MTTVLDILRAKPSCAILTIDASAMVFDAVKTMSEANVGALIVVDRERVAGIVSERDCARKVLLATRSAREMQVHEIMSTPVLVVDPDRTIEQCMALMTENRLRHLPVMEGTRLVGIVSIGDLVKQVVADQRFTIEQLEHYISGDRG